LERNSLSEMNSIETQWSQFFHHQKAMRHRFGPIWKLPIRKRHTTILADRLERGISVLEIGAHDRNILDKIDLSPLNVEYRSLDKDDSLPHDYHDITAVDRTFDQIWMFEVIEHLYLADAWDLLKKARQLLNRGGLMILSTPNSHHPHRFREPHHLTPFKFDNLCALLASAGFEVEAIYRTYSATLVEKLAHRFLLGWLHRFLDIDFATTLVAVARRSGE